MPKEIEILPYEKRDLSRKVSDLLDYEQLREGEREGKLLKMLVFPYGKNEVYDPCEELVKIVENVPTEHEITQEIIKQTNDNLQEVCLKSNKELLEAGNKFRSSFRNVASCGKYENLFDVVQKAANYIVDSNPLTEDNPPQEAFIIVWAASGMLRYSESHSKEVSVFVDKLWNKRSELAAVIRGYEILKNPRAIDIYFEIFDIAKGNEEFILDGIQKSVGFDFIAKCLKKAFPEYDFTKKIQEEPDNKLREKLTAYFRNQV